MDFVFFAETVDEVKQQEPEIKEVEKKSLPDLDKYWKAVNDDPTDFTAWTYLLQYVDQEVIAFCFKFKSILGFNPNSFYLFLCTSE